MGGLHPRNDGSRAGPDYINRAMTGYAAKAPFSQADPRFGQNAIRYYEYLQKNDLPHSRTDSAAGRLSAVNAAKQAGRFSLNASRKKRTQEL